METFRILVDRLASPLLFFTLASALTLSALRSPLPWTRLGGGLILLVTLAFGGLALTDPNVRELVSDPERLPALLLVLASGAVLWSATRASRQDRPVTTRIVVPSRGAEEEDEKPPVFFAEEILIGGGLIVLTAMLAFFASPPLGRAADFSSPPTAEAAPWFLRGLQDLAGFFDPWVPFLFLPVLALVALVALPYLDVPREEIRSPGASGSTAMTRTRREVTFFFILGFCLLLLLPAFNGAFLRHDVQQPLPTPQNGLEAKGLFNAYVAPPDLELIRPLSRKLWGSKEPPRFALLRELPVLLLLVAYFVLPPMLLLRWRPTKKLFESFRRRLGRRRFHLGVALVLIFLWVPLKMYSRWLFDIDYFLYLPEIGLNL